jgi:cobalt-zinc-cadmium resistance protein CzcA
MIERILFFSIRNRWFIILAVIGFAVYGAHSYGNLTIDAVPDITNVQVQINAQAKGFTPLEVEQRVTFPLETALSGLPGLELTRSISRYGISQINAIFRDGVDIYFARQVVSERIQEAREKLPSGVSPVMGPISTGLGEIFMWVVEAAADARKSDGAPFNLTDLRTIQDWIIKPQLRNVPGVAEVNAIGGFDKQFHVTPHPDKLMSYGVSYKDVMEALAANNENVGAGYIERGGREYLVRVPGRVAGIPEIRDIIVGNYRGIPIRVKDVGEVILGKELRTGAATENGRETVLGTVLMLKGENGRAVAQKVATKLEEVNRTLPTGVTARPVYDRTVLVDKTIATVRNNLFEGAALVVLILFIFLGNVRAAILTAMVIPLSMLFTVTGMATNKVSANLMSLGAIDFGIIIDGAVVIVENCARRLALDRKALGRPLTKEERFRTVRDASKEVRTPMLFGELIIMIVYLPILTLTGVEGKMFVPMGLTVIMALTGALILSFTFVPAATAAFLSGSVSEKENRPTVIAVKLYTPSLRFALANRVVIVAGALTLTVLCVLLATRMGKEFVPSLDEGDIAVHTLRAPGVSLTQAIDMQTQVEKTIIEHFPQVRTVFSRIGTAEIATDAHPPNIAENTIVMKPRDQWPDPKLPKSELVAQIEEAAQMLPGTVYEFSQPIQLRFNEMLAGVRSDVAVKLFGDDLDTLLHKAQEIERVLSGVRGAAHVKVEQVAGLPVLSVNLNRKDMARYGINVSEVQELVEIGVGGKTAGQIFEGDRRFDLAVRLPENLRGDISALERLPLPLPLAKKRLELGASRPAYEEEWKERSFITLDSVADFKVAEGPNQISREDGKRRIVVTANVRGRDMGGFVKEAAREIAQKVAIPPGYWIAWGGQFEQMISAARRLQIVVPSALLLIFLLLFAAFGSVKHALLVFTGVPLALTGGIAGLWLRDIPLSISAGVGFIALSGVATLNGLVMITFINKLIEEGKGLEEAVFEGAMTRLRPVLMTALTASFGFLPMAVAAGTGAEVQRPLATVVIGGLISSTALTLLVLPALYLLTHTERKAPTVQQGAT